MKQNPESEIVCSEIEPQAVCDGVPKALCTAPRNATGATFAFHYELAESSDPNIADLEKELSDKIGLKTEIEFNENASSGSLKLYYSDLNQLDEIMKRLKR